MPKKRTRPAVTVQQLVRVLKVDSSCVYRWIRLGFIHTMTLRGYHQANMIIKRDDAVRILRHWRRTCTPTEVSQILGVTDGAVYYFIRKSRLRRLKMFGLTRVVRSSIPRVLGKVGDGVIYPEKVGFARLSKAKLREFASRTRQSPNRYILTKEDRQKGGREALKIAMAKGKIRYWTREEAIKMSRKSGPKWTREQAVTMARKSVESRRRKVKMR